MPRTLIFLLIFGAFSQCWADEHVMPTIGISSSNHVNSLSLGFCGITDDSIFDAQRIISASGEYLQSKPKYSDHNEFRFHIDTAWVFSRSKSYTDKTVHKNLLFAPKFGLVISQGGITGTGIGYRAQMGIINPNTNLSVGLFFTQIYSKANIFNQSRLSHEIGIVFSYGL